MGTALQRRRCFISSKSTDLGRQIWTRNRNETASTVIDRARSAFLDRRRERASGQVATAVVTTTTIDTEQPISLPHRAHRSLAKLPPPSPLQLVEKSAILKHVNCRRSAPAPMSFPEGRHLPENPDCPVPLVGVKGMLRLEALTQTLEIQRALSRLALGQFCLKILTSHCRPSGKHIGVNSRLSAK